MAPNKKKKKQSSNPARGFATTSVASKPKIPNDTLGAESVFPNEDISISNPNLSDDPTNSPVLRTTEKLTRELYQLSPEELERQLEESDLQLLLEKNGEKSKKDAIWQVSRLSTERRTLRPQATYLHTHTWLPVELMQRIIDLNNEPLHRGSANTYSGERKFVPALSEDDLLIKLWTLKQTLCKLGFSQERSNFAISRLLERGNTVQCSNSTAAKEFIWGLEDCLDWLASICDPEEIPGYETLGSKCSGMQPRSLPAGWLAVGSGTLSCMLKSTADE